MDYRQIVRDEASKIGLDPNIAEATLAQESGGDPSARSPKGAQGFMQLMPATARELGVDPSDPLQNIQGGVRYLKTQIDKFGIPAGLAAYNAGPGRVQKTADFSQLPSETQKYVPQIMNKAAMIAQNNSAAPQQAPAGQEPDIGTLMGGYQKAQAAGDKESTAEIGGLLQKKFGDALAKAKAANDTDAVNEITASMGRFGAPPAAPASPTPAKAPVAAPTASTKAPATSGNEPSVLGAVKDPEFWKSLGRNTDDLVRGIADTVTFGYADEGAAKMDTLTGGGQSGKTNYDEALKAQRQRDKEGGVSRTAGQVAGALIPTGTAVSLASGATKLSRVGAGALTGAIQGGLYGTGSAEGDLSDRLEGGAKGAAVGAVLGGALPAVLPLTKSQQVNRFVADSGDEALARTDAEVIRRAQSVLEDANRASGGKTPPLSAAELNGKVTESFLRDAKAAVKSLPKDFTGKKELTDALASGRRLSPEELDALRKSEAGGAVADAIQAAQRADKVTAAQPSTGGVMPLLREGVDQLPIPVWANRGLKAAMGGRSSREQVADRLVNGRGDAAALVRERLGSADATTAVDTLKGLAAKAQKAQEAKIATAAKAKADAAAADAATRLQVLQGTRQPLSGAFQELVKGGRSNLNLTSKDAIDALRLTSRQLKDNPVGEAARGILKSGNVPNADAFYGLQNHLRKLQEQGILSAGQGGALSQATAAVRNPISYAEAVRTAGAAADMARKNAPTGALAQFASTVAGTKGLDAKAKLLQARLAKSTDQAEIDYLTRFVEPLTKFGKKQ